MPGLHPCRKWKPRRMTDKRYLRSRWFEDIPVGEFHVFGSYTFSEQEIIDFGNLYAPQPYHTDPDAALETRYRGLVQASAQIQRAVLRPSSLDHTGRRPLRGVEARLALRRIRLSGIPAVVGVTPFPLQPNIGGQFAQGGLAPLHGRSGRQKMNRQKQGENRHRPTCNVPHATKVAPAGSLR